MKYFWSYLLISISLAWVLPANSCYGDSDTEFQNAQIELNSFLDNLNNQDKALITRTSYQKRNTLSPSLRKKWHDYRGMKDNLTHWQNVVSLKLSLLSLSALDDPSSQFQLDRIGEAEAIAITAINAFDELKEKYQMGNSALLHNLSIHMGLRKEGYCWHWTRDLMQRLKSLKLKTFDLHWATAREGSLLEHNTVVIVPTAQPFTEGLLLDGWRKSGKPFWMKLADDTKHPWKLSRE